MPANKNPNSNGSDAESKKALKLDARKVAAIEEALKKVGPFGEVHLMIEKGVIRFIRTLKSESLDDESMN